MTKSIPSFKNKNLKKIINVYRKKKSGDKTYGFGDFLRGCFCLAQICSKHGLEFDIDISNHPLSKFIISAEENPIINYGSVPHFENINHIGLTATSYKLDSHKFYSEFINLLNTLDVENYYMQCNSFPAWTNISLFDKQIIRSKILPTYEMKEYINNTLVNLGMQNSLFGIIHIRTGDDFLVNRKELDYNKLSNIINTLRKVIIKNKKYIIISDNNILKSYIKKLFNNVNCYIFPITHLGEDSKQTDESLKNTMLDFFIIGYSKFVIGISFYSWGSGFSEWSSAMHNVPYKKIILTNNPVQPSLPTKFQMYTRVPTPSVF